MFLIEPNIHPVLVHFAYALTIMAVICFWFSSGSESGKRRGLAITANWLLTFSAVAIVLTILAGLQAYYSVAHDGPSHKAMTTHKYWAIGSGLAILLLALWRWMKRGHPASGLFKSTLTVAALGLSVAAWWGGHIVYEYGIGVKNLPEISGDGHDHDHGDHGQETVIAETSVKAAEQSKTSDVKTDKAETASGHDHSSHDHGDGDHAGDKPIKQIWKGEDKEIFAIMEAIEKGWEQGDGTPFRQHFLDYDEARYFESGGENTGLEDLVVNHVEPEKTAIPDLELGLNDIQIHREGDFAWAVASTTVQGTLTRDGSVLDRTGKHSWIFKKVDGEWKVLHTHSSSRAKRK